jgi:predicted amidophosphoribosyltransferase
MTPSVVPPVSWDDTTRWQWAQLSSGLRVDDRPIASTGPKRVALARGLESIASLVAPPLCAACGAPRPAEVVICERCSVELATAPRVRDPGPRGVDLAVSASPFDGVARRVVHGLKYGCRLSLAGVAAEAMLRALPDRESPDAVVPVPAGPWRWRWRGFDPAEEIAIAVSERARLSYRPCLRRDRGRRQVGRRRSERLTDAPRVRAVADPPRAVLLVDDVWTTGATLAACAAALRAAGSRRVVALTLAHAL